MVTAEMDELGNYTLSTGTASHFSRQEMSCSCGCGEDRMVQDIIDKAEQYRLTINSPVYVVRGVSCVVQNKRDGGAADSQHLPVSTAFDSTVHNGMSEEDLFQVAVKIFNRVGMYFRKANLHCDMKRNPDGTPEHLYWYRDMQLNINGFWTYSQYVYFTDPVECVNAYTARKIAMVSQGWTE